MIAYRFGAIFLAMPPPRRAGTARSGRSRCSRRGSTHNPTRWQFAHDIGVHPLLVHRRLRAGGRLVRACRDDAARARVDWTAGRDDQGAGREPRRRAADARRAPDEIVRGVHPQRGRARTSAAQGARRDRPADTLSSSDSRRGADSIPPTGRSCSRATPCPADRPDAPFVYDPTTARRQLSPTLALAPLPDAHPANDDWRSCSSGWAVFGLMVGSFLNVCIARIPAGESIVTPGSRCPTCRTPIAWYDNIPVLSYLILGGRCRKCQTRISLRYPIVEIVTARRFRAAGLCDRRRRAAAGGARLVFTALLIALFGTDLDTMRLPNVITLPGIVVRPARQPLAAARHRVRG